MYVRLRARRSAVLEGNLELPVSVPVLMDCAQVVARAVRIGTRSCPAAPRAQRARTHLRQEVGQLGAVRHHLGMEGVERGGGWGLGVRVVEADPLRVKIRNLKLCASMYRLDLERDSSARCDARRLCVWKHPHAATFQPVPRVLGGSRCVCGS